jgi:alkylhydroperoxidase family enzyme
MGHTEMLLAVAGLDNKAIQERTRRLGEGDWSSFTPAERVAFGFAHKQTKKPAAVADNDVRALVEHFGPDRALDVVWWTCRCHYMTCVSDAFQLPLERENVFDGFLSRPGPGDRGAEPPAR